MRIRDIKIKNIKIISAAILMLLLIFYIIISGLFGAVVYIILLALTFILALITFIIKRYWKRSKRKIFRILKLITLSLLVLTTATVFVYGNVTVYRFVHDSGELPLGDRYLAVIVVDGGSLIQARELLMKGLEDNSSYATQISKNFPVISEYFLTNGAFTAFGISVWPSSSVPAHTGIVTGSYPRNTGIIGQRQFDVETRKHTSYIGLGILSYSAILSKKTKALCEYFPNARSVDILQIANRGCSLYIPGTPHDEQVVTRAVQIIGFSDFIGKFSRKKEIPRVIIMTLPDIDHQTHNRLLTDEISINLYLKTDEYIGKIFDVYKEKGIFNKTLFVLASDHGMGEVKNHVTIDNLMHDMRFDTFQSLKWMVVPAWGSFEANFYVGSRYKFDHSYNSVSLWGGNSDALVYIKGQIKDEQGKVIEESWDIKTTDEMLKSYSIGGDNINVIERLLEYSPGIGLIFTNPVENIFNIYSSKGQGQILERHDKGLEFQYSIISGEDPLGFAENKTIAPYIENKSWLSDRKWLDLTYYEHYPDALRRISYSLGNKDSATMHIVAADGWDFTPYYVAKKVLVGSHGSLNSQQSFVPIMFYGPGIKHVEIPYARTVDILPTILKYFNISAENIDGRALPVFEDESKNQ
ncbi:alkaline phosphatase family protein [Candidatus Pacearchaeota archaeon]|nr:alkaline phosphatase family protein [Candidatus Pacearchaeota archaeon]